MNNFQIYQFQIKMDELNIAQVLQIFLKPRREVTRILNAGVLLQVEWLIVFWVRDLTASMHLGLNQPFVPHINQRSPEAPLKFQMAS